MRLTHRDRGGDNILVGAVIGDACPHVIKVLRDLTLRAVEVCGDPILTLWTLLTLRSLHTPCKYLLELLLLSKNARHLITLPFSRLLSTLSIAIFATAVLDNVTLACW